MTDRKTITVSDVRRERRLARNGVTTFETLTIISTANEIFSGYLNESTIVPKIGQSAVVSFREMEKRSGEKFNQILKVTVESTSEGSTNE